MKKTYYMVCCNDGCEVSNTLATLKEAKRELASIIKEDNEMGIGGINDYYICKYVDEDNVVTITEIEVHNGN